jgi:amino acid transporter
MSTPSPDTPRFGLVTMTCVVIAGMIGSGVFTTSGFALADLQSPARVLLAWSVGGAIAVCGAIAYGELARRLPQSGGEYLYLSRLLHPFVGFLAGWISLTVGFSGSIALVALTFEEYVVPAEIRATWLPAGSAAIAVIVIFGFGHRGHQARCVDLFSVDCRFKTINSRVALGTSERTSATIARVANIADNVHVCHVYFAELRRF